MKSYTDLSQSKRLAEILPLESADMYYSKYDAIHAATLYSSCDTEYFKIHEYIPCWSLAVLLNVLPFPQLSKDKLGSGKAGWMVSVYPNNCRYDSCWHDNPIDACYEMVLILKLEQKML